MQIATKKRRHAAAAFCQRSLLERYIVSYGAFASGTIRQALDTASPNAVVALVGIGSVFPFLRASSVIKSVDSAVTGRLLVLFPGLHDPENHSFRLLDARDGFNYRARVIDSQKDLA